MICNSFFIGIVPNSLEILLNVLLVVTKSSVRPLSHVSICMLCVRSLNMLEVDISFELKRTKLVLLSYVHNLISEKCHVLLVEVCRVGR